MRRGLICGIIIALAILIYFLAKTSCRDVEYYTSKCVGNADAPNPVKIPDSPGKSGFKCKTEYKLGPCPEGANGCINIKNLCKGPVWAFGQYGSPPNVFMYKKLESGQSYQYVIYQDTMEAARIIFYYQDPLSMPEWAKDPKKGIDDLALMKQFKECEITTLAGGAPPNMNQLTEFTFAKDDATQKRFMDYDVSYVDSASIPIYMYAPGSDNNPECNQTFVQDGGNLQGFYEGCPTGLINNSGDFKTCVGSFNWCNDPNAMTDPNKKKYCTLLDDYAAKLNITPELLKKYNWVYGPTAAIYGGTFEPGVTPAKLADLTPMKTISINRGTCTDPMDKDNCGGDNAEWSPKVPEYSLDQRNDYSRWIRSKGKNYYGFSMDEGGVGGNQQCRYSTQLDIVICPDC